MRHRSARLCVLTLAMAGVGCGSDAGAGRQPPTPSSTATATAAISPAPCGAAASPSAHAPIGATQALSVISIVIVAGAPASAGVMKLGMVSCVTVGVGQVVSIEVRARIPPLPAESKESAPLLSAITVFPAVASPASVPQAGEYAVTFTALRAGATALTYLPATCTLPPGVC